MAGLDIASLEIFRSVAQEGSVSKAAVRLNRVQSNVSTRLKQLEEHLGVALFLRTRGGFTLTDEGRTLLRYADRLIGLSQEAAEAVWYGPLNGTLKLGTMESTAATRLPEILATFHARFPEVDLHVQTDTAGGLLSRLQAGNIDAAFVAEPVAVEGVETSPVFSEELVLIGPAKAPKSLRASYLNGKTIIAFEEGCAYRRYLQSWLLEEAVTPAGTISVGSYIAMIACVAAGAGYAVAPKTVLETLSANGKLQQYQLPKKYRSIRTLLARRASFRSPKLDELIKLLPN